VHNFGDSAVGGLPKHLEIWDLDQSVLDGSCVVGVGILP